LQRHQLKEMTPIVRPRHSLSRGGSAGLQPECLGSLGWSSFRDNRERVVSWSAEEEMAIRDALVIGVGGVQLHCGDDC
jgi:hypothetical protein